MKNLIVLGFSCETISMQKIIRIFYEDYTNIFFHMFHCFRDTVNSSKIAFSESNVFQAIVAMSTMSNRTIF